MMREAVKAAVHVNQLEPGNHISRKTVANDVLTPVVYMIPADECEEIRPDWGVYSPTKTLPALERALRKRGAFNRPVPPDCVFSYGFDN